MAEAPPPSFTMHGARNAMASGLTHIEEQVKGIERAVVENPGLAFDLAKTLIESTCKALLSDRSIGFNEDDDLPKLFKAVSNAVPFLPAAASGEAKARKSLAQTLSGLHTAIHGVCELRNQCGFASHGSDKPRPAMESVQAMLAAAAADAVVGFLYRVHRTDGVLGPGSKTEYDDNPTFNSSVDDKHGMIQIFEVEFRPSEVLFQMEPESYRVYLTEFNGESERSEPSTGSDAPAEAA